MTTRFAPKAQLPLSAQQQRWVLENHGLAEKSARWFLRKHQGALGEDDIRQLIDLALTEAARTWDPEVGVAFASFAWHRIAGRLAEAAENEGKQRELARRAAAACMAIQRDEGELDDPIEAVKSRLTDITSRVATAMLIGLLAQASIEDAAGAEELFLEHDHRAKLRAALEAALARIPERRRRIVEAYYRQGRDLRETAAELGVSYATVRREHNEALDELRVLLVKAGVKEEGAILR